MQKKLPWGIVLLLGGGFALAKGSEVSDVTSFPVTSLQISLIYSVAHMVSGWFVKGFHLEKTEG